MSDEQFRELLGQDPGDPAFAEFADILRRDGRHGEGFEVCFAGLTANPGCHRGRLVLARLFYERLYWPFAVRELKQLAEALPDNKQVRRLLERMAPETASARRGEESDVSADTTVAEAEFDVADVELMGED